MKSEPLAECHICAKPFMRRTTFQRLCSPKCIDRAAKAGERAVRVAKVAAAKAERASFRQRKEAAKTRSELIEEAKTAMHKYIRLRDYGKPCICCGKPMPWGESQPGGYIDAGHYMSVGSCPELRFVETNVSAQLKSCNKPGGTTRASFKAGMVERWGLAEVERLEGPNPAQKYTADRLRAIRAEYKLRAIQLKGERDA